MLIGKSVTYLDIAESPRSARLAARRGDHDSIHSTALGKAIAATMSDEEVTELLSQTGLPKRTERTITDTKSFLAELARVREVGYAVDDRENEDEGRCVAVFVPRLGVPVAISVSGLASRFSMNRVADVARSLLRVAVEIAGPPAGQSASAPVLSPTVLKRVKTQT
jgi:IclR family acetate operon transcriptional repressor